MNRLLAYLLILSLVTACTATPTSISEPSSTSVPPADLTRTDTQGAVEFAVTPLNLQTNATTLEFNVTMDTHSVDLGWDLAAQAVLKTDTGLEVSGDQWAVGSGHHYESTLVFPANTTTGQPVLQTAQTLTLIISNTDVPERIFVWELTP